MEIGGWLYCQQLEQQCYAGLSVPGSNTGGDEGDVVRLRSPTGMEIGGWLYCQQLEQQCYAGLSVPGSNTGGDEGDVVRLRSPTGMEIGGINLKKSLAKAQSCGVKTLTQINTDFYRCEYLYNDEIINKVLHLNYNFNLSFRNLLYPYHLSAFICVHLCKIITFLFRVYEVLRDIFLQIMVA